MSKKLIMLSFAERLREIMTSAGFRSTRSTSGICIQTLTQITGHSRQICRKYLQGEVLPEPHTLLKLAHALQVSPGWLLFGEGPKTHAQEDKIVISKTLLHYVLTHPENPYQRVRAINDIPDFLAALIQEISVLEGDEAQLKKIVDLALSSAKHFDQANHTVT